MARHTIRKGLDLPITGTPRQEITTGKPVSTVAILAADYVGMKPSMEVQLGDLVQRGSLLFLDRKQPGVRHTSPGAGTVVAINRGERRAFQSVVIELNEREQAGSPSADDFATFESYAGQDLSTLTREQVRALMVESGAWTSLRQRPYSCVPSPSEVPHSIFVQAIDSRPLAGSVDVCMDGEQGAFEAGLRALQLLTDGPVHLCRAPGGKASAGMVDGIELQEFVGPHPAGLAGTHIHFVDPVHRAKQVWYVNYADVQMIGKLFTDGRLHVERVVALGGPPAADPRLVRSRIGANLDQLMVGEVSEGGEHRVVSGCVLSGRKAMGKITGFLGRYDLQVSVVREGREREFLGWLTPGEESFSIFPTYVSKLFAGHRFNFTTTTNGSHRAMVPIGMYEDVMPLDILPTFLLRSIAAGDLERAEQLGCMELDEEDLGLCTMVCPGKNDYGQMLRDTLDTIRREG